MQQRLTMVTLGVKDVARARAFYEALGWRAARDSNEHIAFFDLGGIMLALYGMASLRDDLGTDAPSVTPGPATLAHNVADKAAVDRILAEAEAVGARIVRPATDQFWGGYSGQFADPDGHYWEIAWNPHWPLDETGRLDGGR